MRGRMNGYFDEEVQIEVVASRVFLVVVWYSAFPIQVDTLYTYIPLIFSFFYDDK